jgi:hypothetical protein
MAFVARDGRVIKMRTAVALANCRSIGALR